MKFVNNATQNVYSYCAGAPYALYRQYDRLSQQQLSFLSLHDMARMPQPAAVQLHRVANLQFAADSTVQTCSKTDAACRMYFETVNSVLNFLDQDPILGYY